MFSSKTAARSSRERTPVDVEACESDPVPVFRQAWLSLNYCLMRERPSSTCAAGRKPSVVTRLLHREPVLRVMRQPKTHCAWSARPA